MTYNDFYELGIDAKQKYDGNKRAAANDFFNEYGINEYAYKFFLIGFEGYAKPKYVVGWRYGEFTELGCSKNYATDECEYGVSMMATSNGMKTKDMLSAAFIASNNVQYAKGYVCNDLLGSDGEPVMLMARKITKEVFDKNWVN